VAGDLTRADRELSLLERAASATGHRLTTARYWDASAEVLLARGDGSHAEAALSQSVDLWRAQERPYEEAVALTALGRLSQQYGHPEAAFVQTRAHGLFRQLGVGSSLAAPRGPHPAMGHPRSRRRTARERDLLSERERELVLLIDQRCDTNDIAQRLIISRATVRTHIRNIFRKLSVNSRAELRLIARERRLIP
jgi:DNA-binding CsgD family transcriptional regulator